VHPIPGQVVLGVHIAEQELLALERALQLLPDLRAQVLWPIGADNPADGSCFDPTIGFRSR
jgi:hypothetical protein